MLKVITISRCKYAYLYLVLFSLSLNYYTMYYSLIRHFTLFTLFADSTFAYFKKACGQTQSDVVFSSNLHYSNVNLPVEMNGTTTHEVPQEGKAAIGRAYVA